jgi:hypothetical protein
MLIIFTSQNKEISVKLVLFINGEKSGLGTFQQLNLVINRRYPLSCLQFNFKRLGET